MNKTHPTDKNVLGNPLQIAGTDPLTGFYRDGFCCTGPQDSGKHVVAAVVTDAFLEFTLALGNDLISPYPASNFPGLKAGDRWCLCASRWKEAFNAGFAPSVILEATHENALLYASLEELKANEFKI
ncbi:MAG: DUF2237 domain-containing protein [Oligoflexus sp.]|nr:DUF2237 domain-containing protein [Pseudopedobacter sp.]